MFRSIIDLKASYRLPAYIWNDKLRMIEAIKVNAPQYYQHQLKKKALYKPKSKTQRSPFKKLF